MRGTCGTTGVLFGGTGGKYGGSRGGGAGGVAMGTTGGCHQSVGGSGGKKFDARIVVSGNSDSMSIAEIPDMFGTSILLAGSSSSGESCKKTMTLYSWTGLSKSAFNRTSA